MTDEAKPGALLLAVGESADGEGAERSAEPDSDESTTGEATADAARSLMGAMKRGDTAGFADALDAYLTARGK